MIVVRGNPRDVERVMEIIRQIEELSSQTQPEIQIYPLKFVNGSSLSTVVQSLYDQTLATRQGRVTITALGKPNSLLLIGRPEAVQSVIELIKKLDQPVNPQALFQVFPLKNASATAAQTVVNQFFNSRGGFGAGIGGGLAGTASVTLDYRTNSLIVQASPRELQEVESLLKKIDAPASSAVNELRIFTVDEFFGGRIGSDAAASDYRAGATESGRGWATAAGTRLSRWTSKPRGRRGIWGRRARRRRRWIWSRRSRSGRWRRAGAEPDCAAAAIDERAIDHAGCGREAGLSLGHFDRRAHYGRQSGQYAVGFGAGGEHGVDCGVDSADGSGALVGVANQSVRNQERRCGEHDPDARNAVRATTAAGDGDAGWRWRRIRAAGRTRGGGSIEVENTLVPVKFSVDQRTNSIIASGSAEDLEVVYAILLKLDESDVRTRKSMIYRLKNVNALNVANSITQFLTQERTIEQQFQPSGSINPFEEIDREVVVVAEQTSNSLIVSATPRFFDEIRALDRAARSATADGDDSSVDRGSNAEQHRRIRRGVGSAGRHLV